jgi:hypothetical protein
MLKKKFKDEAGEVRAALAAELRATPKFRLADHDFDAPGAFVAPSPAGDQGPGFDAPPPDDPDDWVDPSELVDAPRAAGPADSVDRIVEAFPGAEIVEERPR